jgi:hypothetical protein
MASGLVEIGSGLAAEDFLSDFFSGDAAGAASAEVSGIRLTFFKPYLSESCCEPRDARFLFAAAIAFVLRAAEVAGVGGHQR